MMQLFLQSRRAGWTMLLLGIAGLIGWWWLSRIDEIGPLLNQALIGVPLLAAVIIGVSVHSPFGDTEVTASRRLPLMRSSHVIGLVCVGALAMLVAAFGFAAAGIQLELLRNLAGLTGLALLGNRLIGGPASWVAPLGYATVSLLVDPLSRWGWLIRQPADAWSVGVAAVLLAAGWIAVSFDSGRATVSDVV